MTKRERQRKKNSNGKICGTEKEENCFDKSHALKTVKQFHKGKLVSIKKSFAYKKIGKKT